METQTLRRSVASFAREMRGRVWPNGLGFDWHGWELSVDEQLLEWRAVYRTRDRRLKVGLGKTPEAAVAAARKRGPIAAAF